MSGATGARAFWSVGLAGLGSHVGHGGYGGYGGYGGLVGLVGLVGLGLIGIVGAGCGRDLVELEPFPVAEDGTCPGSFVPRGRPELYCTSRVRCEVNAICPVGQICDRGECRRSRPFDDCETQPDCPAGHGCVDHNLVPCEESRSGAGCICLQPCTSGQACPERRCQFLRNREGGYCCDPDWDVGFGACLPCLRDVECADGLACIDGECLVP